MHSHNVKFYFKENEDEDSTSESEEENQEMSHPNSTSSAEEDARKMPYDLLQCFMNAKIHNHKKCSATATVVSGMASLALSNLMIVNIIKTVLFI